ncbi:uncharacterized protein LOC129962762 [Argiope bruennichi]|uniref:uncharacterized protein LOC129962762 n=1 Tax=Argiope bruennichi TaxID=94029 RepID=UPI00249511E2|nr:uncharacterized protein LOC129962762 [Argiope bruennichi]
MTQPDDAGNNPVNYDLTELTSIGLALFDIRNWYAYFLRLAVAGKRITAHCWNMLIALLDSMELFSENAKNTCCPNCSERLPLSRQKSKGTSQNTPLTIRQIGNSSGGWVFMPNVKEGNSKRNTSTGTKGHNHPAGDQMSQNTTKSVESPKRSVTFSIPVSSTQNSIKSKSGSVSNWKKQTTSKKCCPHKQKSPKSAKEAKSAIEISIPLISQRPKRQRKEN